MVTKDIGDKIERMKITEKKTSQSPLQEGLDPIHLLRELDGFIETLSGDPSGEHTERIQKRLQKMEIVALNFGDGALCWLKHPLTISKYTIQRSLLKRIKHLVKTRGWWPNKYEERGYLRMEAFTFLPIGDAEAVEGDGHHSLLLSIMRLHQLIEEILEEGFTPSVFQKPEGVICANELKMWSNGVQDLGNKLHVINLYEVLKATCEHTPRS